MSHSCDSCIKFTYNSYHRRYKLSNLKLWVYQKPQIDSRHGNKKYHSKFSIELLKTDSTRSGRIILKSKIRSRRPSWVGINIKNTKVWIQHQDLELQLKLSCTNCWIVLEDGKQPFLEITEKIKLNPRRVRREANRCTKNSNNCCIDDFIVDFKKIKWDNWILYPPFYNVRQCSGRCDATNLTPLNKHSSLLKAVAMKSNDTDSLKFCCTPKTFIHLEVIYKNNNGDVFQKFVPNMVTTSCGCSFIGYSIWYSNW